MHTTQTFVADTPATVQKAAEPIAVATEYLPQLEDLPLTDLAFIGGAQGLVSTY